MRRRSSLANGSPASGMLGKGLAALVLLALILIVPPASAASGTTIPRPSWGLSLLGPSFIEASAADADGNSYFLGHFSSPTALIGPSTTINRIGSFRNLVLGKVSPAGDVIWARAVGGSSGSAAVDARGVVVDPSGNVYALGDFTAGAIDAGGTGNIGLNGLTANSALIKFRPDGSIAWGIPVATAGDGSVGTSAIALDSSHNPVVAGRFSATGTITVASQVLARPGPVGNLFVARFDAATGAGLWAGSYAAADSDGVGRVGIGVDGADNIYVLGTYNAGMAFGSISLAPANGLNYFLAKLGPTGTPIWGRSFGGSGSTTADSTGTYDGFVVDTDGNSYFIGGFSGGTFLVAGTSVPWTGSSADVLVGKIDPAGNTVWARNFGTSGATNIARGVAVDGGGNVYVAGGFNGATLDIGGTLLTRAGTYDAFVARLNDAGGIDWARNYGAVGSSTIVYPIAIGGSSTLAIYGAYGPAAVAFGDTTLTAGSGRKFGVGISQIFVPPPPPPPPPAFVRPTNPPPTAINANTTGSGQGTVSLASSFSSTEGLTFTVTQTSGAALPGWLTFDPATVSFHYDVPLPPDLPIQPSANAGDATGRAGRSIVNTVYPLSVLVQTIPVSLTATGGGQTYNATINMDFYAPRSPVAMTAVSYSAAGGSGNAASAKPAVSWDAGQVVFETAATNINAPADGAYSSIVRYHGLSGRRDLLSQTAIPGGGVANAANGDANNPAVSAAGSHAAFSSAAPGLSATASNGLRQIYRTTLGYPRIALNEAVTPAAVMASTTASGIAADAPADMPSITENGTLVAFESAAGNLGRNPNRLSQIWRKNMTDGAMMLVSSTSAGEPGNGDSRNVALSWDGNFAVFDSTATNLVPGTGGRHIYLKNLIGGQVYRLSLAPGASNARIDARITSVIYTSIAGAKAQVIRYDIASGATTVVSATPSGVAGNGDSTQATMSADGRFVAFRSTSTDLAAGYVGNGQSQIWVRDVLRGVTALVTQTEGGAPGGGASSDPAMSGGGSAIAFASQARDLVNGMPLPGQIHLAGNPLVLPGGTGYWYTADGGNLTWSVERWGDKALIAGLAYGANGGPAVWAAGSCQFAGLTCQGTVSQWSGTGTQLAPLGAVTLNFAADGRTASFVLGSGAVRSLALYPIAGTRTTGYGGLPQSGYWGVDGNAAGVTSLFIDTDTQVTSNGASSHAIHVTLFGYDAAGNAQWYAAEGALSADLSFSGMLYLYAGGASWSGTGSNAPSSTAVGELRLQFAATDRAMVQLPDGRTATINRWRF